MASRYTNRGTVTNDNEMYKEVLEDRGVVKIKQYKTPKVKRLTPAQRRKIITVDHIWKSGDKYYKLAHKHYGNPSLWWVIAQFNFAPTEAHLFEGRLLKIPVSVEQIMRYY